MTGPHLCEYQKWPGSERKPLVYVLCVPARTYETDPMCLLDLVDHGGLDSKYLLAVTRSPQRPRAARPPGEKPFARPCLLTWPSSTAATTERMT